MNFASAEKLAAALLYEGYILYPYRATAVKNQQRWNFGTLYPRVYAEAQRPQERYRFSAQCLVEASAEATLHLRVQCLQLRRQDNESSSDPTQAPALLMDPSLAWDEAVECTAEFQNLVLFHLCSCPKKLPLKMSVGSTENVLQVQGLLKLAVEALPGGMYKLSVEIENISSLPSGADAKRDEALPLSLVSAHALVGVTAGSFLSLLDPPPECVEAAAGCRNEGVFPVLAGDEPGRGVMLLSPIILYDYPKIAPESEGDFFDGTEMDEMLTLRVLTLTEAEKQQMREGDPHARRILERTESLSPEAMMKTHGVIRAMRNIREGGL